MKILVRAILCGIGGLLLALPFVEPKAEALLAAPAGVALLALGAFARIEPSQKTSKRKSGSQVIDLQDRHGTDGPDQ
jgi:hypothetical protein